MNEPQSINDIIAQNQSEPDALPSEPRPITLQELRGQAPLIGAPPAEVRDLDRARRERLKMAVSNTATIDPEKAASRQQIAERLGIPSALMGNDDTPLMRQILAEEVERLRLSETNPKFAESLTDSQEWAAISSDSLERLNQWTYQLVHSRFAKSSFLPDFIDRAIVDTALAFDSGYNRSMANRMAMKDNILGAYVRPDSDPDLIRRPATDTFGNLIPPTKDEQGRMVSAPTLVDRFQRSRLSAPTGDPDNWFVGVLRYTGEQLGQKLASYDLYGTAILGGATSGATIGGSMGGWPGALAGGVKGALYGWRVGAFADGFVNEGGAAYLEMRAQGIQPDMARAMSITHGTVSGVLEAAAAKVAGIPFEKAASHALKMQARRALTKTTKWMIAREAAFDLLKVNTAEAITEASQAASFELAMQVAKWAQDPDGKFRLMTPEGRAEVIGAAMNDFWYTFKYGWLMSSSGPSLNAMTRFMRFQRDSDNFDRLENLIEQAKDLKPLDRNPELAKRVLTTMVRGTDAENLFMDADGVDAFLQQTGLTIEQADELLPGMADKYAQSRREGNAPFSIPTAEYLTRARGSKFEPALRQQLKVGPDGRSLGQVLALQPMRAQMEQEFRDEMARRTDFEKTYARELDEIEERAFAQLSGSDTKLSALHVRIAAKALRDNVLTRAAIMNISPAEAERRYPLNIEGVRRAMTQPPVARQRAEARKAQLPKAAEAELLELQAAMETALPESALDAKLKKRLADSSRRINQSLKLGDVIAIAVETWKLERRIKNGSVTPEAEALLSKLKSILKELGVEVEDPTGKPYAVGWVEVEVVTSREAKPGEEPYTVVQTIEPVVRMNGEIVKRAQVIVTDENEAQAQAREAREQEQEEKLRARLEGREAAPTEPTTPTELNIGPDAANEPPARPRRRDTELSQEAMDNTPEWRDWWKDSKAVGPDGKPLILFRGTSVNPDYGDQSQIPTAGLSGGIFLSTDAGYAGSYGESVIEVVISVQRPLDVSAAPAATLDEWRDILKEAGMEVTGLRFDSALTRDPLVGEVLPDGRRVYGFYELISKMSDYYANDGNLIAEILRQGFDGVISQPEAITEDETAPVWIVFESNQIKSVDNMRPTESPNIYEQAASIDSDYMARVNANDVDGAQALVDEVAMKMGYVGPHRYSGMPDPATPRQFWWAGILETNSSLLDSEARLPQDPANTGAAIIVYEDAGDANDAAVRRSKVNLDAREATREVKVEQGEQVDAGFEPQPYDPVIKNVYIRTVRTLNLDGSNPNRGKQVMDLITEYFTLNPDQLTNNHPTIIRFDWMLEMARQSDPYGWIGNQFRDMFLSYAGKHIEFTKWLATKYDSIIMQTHENSDRVMVVVFSPQQVKDSSPVVRHYSGKWPEYKGIVPLSVRFNITSDILFEQPGNIDRRHYALWRKGDMKGGQELVDSVAQQTGYGGPYPQNDLTHASPPTPLYWSGTEWHSELPDSPVPYVFFNTSEVAQIAADSHADWRHKQTMRRREWDAAKGEDWELTPERPAVYVDSVYINTGRTLDLRNKGGSAEFIRIVQEWYDTNPDALPDSALSRIQAQKVFEDIASVDGRLQTGTDPALREIMKEQELQGWVPTLLNGEVDTTGSLSRHFAKYYDSIVDGLAKWAEDPDYPGEPRFMVYVFDKTRVKRSAPFTMNYNPSANYQTLDGLVPLSARFDISSSNLFEQPAMSTRVPNAQAAIEDAMDEVILADYDAFMRDPTFIAKNLAAFDKLGVPVRFKPNMTDAQKVKAIIDQVEENLLWLHDLMDPAWRLRATKWYEGANKIAMWLAARHGFTPSQAAGIYAVLSPQKDWYENVSLGNRISDIAMTQRSAVMDKAMADAYIASLIDKRDDAKARLASHKKKAKMPKGQGADKLAKWRSERNARTAALAKAELDIIQGRKNVADIGTRTLGELLSAREMMLAAIFVRWFDETKNGKSYGTVTPEGGVTGTEKTLDGRDKIVRYGTYGSVAKALSVILDGSAANIHVQIGSEHKVRNFYNNILNPNDPRFITIDTHAIAASWLLALAGEDSITKHGLGGTVGNSIIGLGGAYALYFEAYKRAAAKRNLIGRQMQSITWEAIRGMFVAAMKQTLKEPIAGIWAEYKAGKITMAQARGKVLAMSNGITAPSWVPMPTNVPTEAGYTGPSRDAADAVAGNNMAATPGHADISFEVRPDPANKKVSRDWDRLPTADRVRISLKIAKDIVDKVLKEYGVTGDLFVQVGGWHDDSTITQPTWKRTTDVSFSLRINDPDKAVAVAKAIGIALSQHGMFVTSKTQFNGSQQSDAILVELVAGTSEKDIADLYEVLLASVLDKHKILGMSTFNDVMVIILPDGTNPATVENDLYSIGGADPRIVDIDAVKVWSRYEDTRAIYSEAEQRGKRGVTGPLFPWRRARELRADATRQLAAELRALNAGRLPQPAIGPAFYSALARAVGSIPSAALPAAEWKNLLGGFVKRGVVKAEEVEWSHIEEFIDMQGTGRIARSAVMDFLRENGVKVATVTQVSRVDSANEIAALAADRAEMELGEEGVLTDELRQQIADYKAAVNNPGSTREALRKLKEPIDGALNSTTGIDLDGIMQNLDDEGAVPAAGFENYGIPGGERYRIRIVTIPSKPVIGATAVLLNGNETMSALEQWVEMKKLLAAAGFNPTTYEDFYFDKDRNRVNAMVIGALPDDIKAWIEKTNGFIDERIDDSATFTSKHFQEVGGYVLHIREQEFVAPDGKRVRVIIEIQSDYAQAVRDLGTKGKPKRRIARVEPIDVVVHLALGDTTKKMFAAYDDDNTEIAKGETVEEARENARRSLNYSVRHLPDGPFIGSTDSWTTLALKEIMRSAVEDGVDSVAFIRGEMAANWFDISHKIDRLDYFKRDNGRYDIEVRPRGKRMMVGLGSEGTNISEDDLRELVGKELADRIIADEGDELKGGWKSVTGLKLKVGGKGMEYYYDTIVMKLLEKLVRKYGGDGVKDIQFAARDRGPAIDWKELAMAALRHMKGETDVREFIDDNGLEGLTSESEVEEMLPQSRDPYNPFPKDIAKAYAKLVASRTAGGKVHTLKGFEFNKAMNDTVSQGLPLFQAARGTPRGYYDPMRSALILTSETDLSTVLHELAHHHLETMVKMAMSPMASDKVRQNLDTVFKWFGIKGSTPEERLATWNAMSLEEKRQPHESFTYNWEIYLFQGKAPAIELEESFRHFTIALKRIYRTGIKEINDNYRERFGTDLPAITPEMRYIFDTLLATDEQIARAEAVREMTPLFKVREDWMTDEEWDEYNRLANAATMESVSELNKDSLSVMQWMSGARMRIVRQMQREHEELRDEVRAEIIQEIDREPVYRAMAYLKYGVSTNPDGSEIEAIGPHRLDMDALEAMYPASMANRPDLNRLGTGAYGMMGRDGVHPDFIAERFGYFSGDQLVRALVAARSRDDEITRRTDQTMIDRYSDLNSEQAQNEAVERALHTEVRSRMIAAETKMLTKSMQPSRLMVDAAKMVARDILSAKRVRDIRPGAYVAGEAQAARDAQNAFARRLTPSQAGQTAFTRAFNEAVKAGMSEEEATKVGEKARDEAMKVAEARDAEYKSRYGKADPEQVVVRAKRNQLLQNQLAKQALSALEEVRKKVRYLRRVLTDESRKRMGADAADQIETLLEKYELKALSLKRIDERKALSKWIAEQEALGITPDIPDHIRDSVGLMSYRDMTLAEFRELFDAIKQIEHFGKNRSKLLAAAKRKSFEEARDQIVLNIRGNASARGRVTKDRTARTKMGRTYENVGKYLGSHLKAATIVQILDGTVDGGPLWEYLTRSANAAGDAETKMMAEATQMVATILKPLYSAESMGGKGQFFPSVNEHLNLEARVVIAANYGNASNRQRLLDGFGWSDEDVQPVLQSLTAQQWRVIQELWNYFESFRPMIAEKERRTKGKEPDWIEPSPFEIETADGQVIQLEGGYYPIVYDPRASTRGGTISEEDMAQRQLQGARMAATTRQSYTKSRVDRVENMPLILDLRGLYRGTNEVIHDLTHHEWLIDANRLLRDEGFASAVRQTLGPESYDQLKQWVADVAAGVTGMESGVDVAANWLRQNISAAGLGYSLLGGAIQPTGVNQSISRIGAKWFGLGLARVISDPVGAFREAIDDSEFMANRGRTQFRELNEVANLVRGQSMASRRYKIGVFLPIVWMQRLVDVPTWHGARLRALADGADVATATARADQAVIDSQGSGLIKDLSRVERGGALLKLFTVFYSYMNTPYNMAALKAMTNKSRGQTVADLLLIFTAPVVLTHMLKSALRPDAEDEEFDLEKLARALAAEQLEYLMGTMVLVREFAYAAKIATGAEGAGRGYGGPAGLRTISDTGVFLTQLKQGEFDTPFRKAAINLLGSTAGLPSVQINRTWDGIQAIAEGEIDNPVDAIRAILFGIER